MREIHAKNVSIIDLGRQGENLATQVIYDLSDWIAEYGDGTAELIHKRIGDSQPYPVAAVRDGNTLIWTLTSTDTAVATKPPSGYGKCEMRWYVGDVLAKSKTWKTLVSQAMDTPSETAPPDHDQGWVDQVVAAGAAAKASAESAKADADRAETAAIKQPYPDAESGTWWIWDAVSGAYVDSGFSALPDTIAGCIHAPATAEVGQTIVVKAVDENGKPTEWEAADMASGGIDWKLVDSRTITVDDSVAELEWTGLDCDNIYFTAFNGYGSNVTCTGIYVNNILVFKDWYQFQHTNSIERNSLLITKMPECYRAEAVGNNYTLLSNIIYYKLGYMNIEKIDSIKFVFSTPITDTMVLSMYKG